MDRRGPVRVCSALLLVGLTASPSASAQVAPGAPAELSYAHDGAIYRLDADGSGRQPIVGGAGEGSRSTDGEPAWAPDGSALAFVRAGTGSEERAQIMLMDATGTRALTQLRRDVFDSSPAWSPDGRSLAFSRFKAAGDSLTSSIVVIARDGSEARVVMQSRLSRALTAVGEPAWLPDGSGISYTRSRLDRRSYSRSAVHVVGPDGSGDRRLLDDASAAAWSPDGSRVAFSSIVDRNGSRCFSDDCSYSGELYVARSDGHERRRLTHNTGNDAEPDWSPDGTRILFSSDRNYPTGQSAEVYSVNADGRCLTWLTNGSPASGSPVWRPGSGARTEPATCGDAGRRPLVEIQPSGSLPDALWLGPISRGLLLGASEGGRQTFFAYDDCGLFRSPACPRPIQVLTSSVCERHAFSPVLDNDPVRLRVARGALRATYRHVEASGFTLYTGRAEVSVSFELHSRRRLQAETRAVMRRLRPVARGDDRPVRVRLPPPRIAPTLARKLRGALAARRAQSTAREAARRLGVSQTTLRRRLRLARALRSAGGIRTARCPKRRSDANRRSTAAPPAARAHTPAR